MKVVVLASGGLGCLVLKEVFKKTDIEFIATDKKSESIIQFSKEKSIPIFIGNPREGELKKSLGDVTSKLLLSVNYLFLIEPDILDLFQYPINFHGSLLPKYRGRTPHVWAIINNENKTGITAHFMDEGCDTGDILLQHEIKIERDETGADILQKYQLLYPSLVLKVISIVASGRVLSKKQDESKATYFGKRSPEDGQINWDWSKLRIRNWVRAQAYPYPGAFSVYENQKIVIDKVEFSDQGFDYGVQNGTILKTEPNLVVKTPDGSIEIMSIRSSNLSLQKGKVFKS